MAFPTLVVDKKQCQLFVCSLSGKRARVRVYFWMRNGQKQSPDRQREGALERCTCSEEVDNVLVVQTLAKTFLAAISLSSPCGLLALRMLVVCDGAYPALDGLGILRGLYAHVLTRA